MRRLGFDRGCAHARSFETRPRGFRDLDGRGRGVIASALTEIGTAQIAVRSAAAGGIALAFGGAPLGVLLIARRMSLSGDALSHGILPGAAIAFLLAGPNPWA